MEATSIAHECIDEVMDECLDECMDDRAHDRLVDALPDALAVAIRLDEGGYPRSVLAAALGIPVQSSSLVLKVARSQLSMIARGQQGRS